MGLFGNLLGQGLGFIGSKLLPIPGVDGRTLGGAIGGLAPFNKGGRVGPVPPGMRRGGKIQKPKKVRKEARK